MDAAVTVLAAVVLVGGATGIGATEIDTGPCPRIPSSLRLIGRSRTLSVFTGRRRGAAPVSSPTTAAAYAALMSRFDRQRRASELCQACLATSIALLGACGVAMGLAVAAARPASAAETAASPNASPKEIRERIDAAAKLLDADNRDAAVESLGEAVRGLEAMASAPRLPAGFKTLADRASGVRRRLEKAGVDVTALVVPGISRTTPATPQGKPAAGAPAVGKAAAVSFSRQVAPILAKSCGGCHIAGRKGDFQMASYEGLMRTGMVQRGQGQASRLVEVILTGDMPRGGGKVTSQDVATLIAWIDAGAPCDAPNPAAPRHHRHPRPPRSSPWPSSRARCRSRLMLHRSCRNTASSATAETRPKPISAWRTSTRS